jgi:Na+-driven multidrug efflux pump
VVARLLRISGAQLPFYFATTVLMNYLASAGLHREIAVGAIFALAAKVTFLALLLARPTVDVLAASGVVYIFAWFAALVVPSLRLRRTTGDNEQGKHSTQDDGAQA